MHMAGELNQLCLTLKVDTQASEFLVSYNSYLKKLRKLEII